MRPKTSREEKFEKAVIEVIIDMQMDSNSIRQVFRRLIRKYDKPYRYKQEAGE